MAIEVFHEEVIGLAEAAKRLPRTPEGKKVSSRRGYDLTGQFPELAALAGLPAGTILDGELVVLQNGEPDRSLVGCRQALASARKIRAFSRSTPATYIVFDQLFERYRSIMNWPLVDRRELMRYTIDRAGVPRLVTSVGKVGPCPAAATLGKGGW